MPRSHRVLFTIISFSILQPVFADPSCLLPYQAISQDLFAPLTLIDTIKVAPFLRHPPLTLIKEIAAAPWEATLSEALIGQAISKFGVNKVAESLVARVALREHARGDANEYSTPFVGENPTFFIAMEWKVAPKLAETGILNGNQVGTGLNVNARRPIEDQIFGPHVSLGGKPDQYSFSIADPHHYLRSKFGSIHLATSKRKIWDNFFSNAQTDVPREIYAELKPSSVRNRYVWSEVKKMQKCVDVRRVEYGDFLSGSFTGKRQQESELWSLHLGTLDLRDVEAVYIPTQFHKLTVNRLKGNKDENPRLLEPNQLIKDLLYEQLGGLVELRYFDLNGTIYPVPADPKKVIEYGKKMDAQYRASGVLPPVVQTEARVE